MTSAEYGQRTALQRAIYESRNPTRRWLHCTRRDWIVEAIRQVSTPGRGKALEVGPGSGVYLPTLANLYEEVTATDVDQEYLSHLAPLEARYSNLHLLQDDITCSQVQESSFDLVLCTEVLEHIANSEKALKEMHRLLKPGGTLVVSTPQRYSPLELAAKIAFLPGIISLVRLVYREPILETGHINLMSASTMRHQLAAAGFKIEHSYLTGMYVPILAEFGGTTALRLEEFLERKLRGGPLEWLLWTQYHIASAITGQHPTQPEMPRSGRDG